MKTFALVAKRGKPEAHALARQIHDRYPAVRMLADRDLAKALGWPDELPDVEIAAKADLAIVLGGDGTLIHAARMLRGRAVPVLGVNLGSLGFMTEIPVGEMFHNIDQLLAGNVSVDSRMKLHCILWRAGKIAAEDEVLNDVVINKGALARITDIELSVNGRYVCTYKSDGVIVSTPTGSTAYALSAGGPIVHPSLDATLVAPICSHALTQRPLLIPADQVIHMSMKTEVSDLFLTLDGQSGLPLQTGDRIEVRRSKNRVLLVRNPKLDYFAILRQKLHWGER